MAGRCRICGDPRTVARSRCGTCYQFLRRRGFDRTERHVIKLTEKDIERDLLRAQRRERGWDPDV